MGFLDLGLMFGCDWLLGRMLCSGCLWVGVGSKGLVGSVCSVGFECGCCVNRLVFWV